MEIKPVVVEVTKAERRAGRLKTGRVAEILDYDNHDSVRQAALRGKFERVGRGYYDLDGVLRYATQRQRTGARRQSEKQKTQ